MYEISDIAIEQIKDANNTSNLQEELSTLESKFKYLQADFDNYRKRSSKEKILEYNRGKEDVLFIMLDAIDNMELMLKSLTGNVISDGFKMIYDNFIKSLESIGCKKIDCKVGDKFDVNFHDALSSVAAKDENDSGKILEIMKSGWMVDGKLFRPIMVVVSK